MTRQSAVPAPLQVAETPLQTGAGPSGGGGVLPGELLVVVAAAALALATLALAATVVRSPGYRRAFGAVGVAIPGALALSYGAVVVELPQQVGAEATAAAPVARFTAYAFALLLASWLLARLGAAGRELALVLAVATLGHVGGVAGWLLLEGAAALAAIATAGALGLVLLYLLLGPVGGDPRGDRGLLYAKLRALLLVGWSLVLVAIALSPRGLGVLDAYTAALVGAYLDVVLGAGLGAVVVRSGGALDRLAGVRDATSGRGAAGSTRAAFGGSGATVGAPADPGRGGGTATVGDGGAAEGDRTRGTAVGADEGRPAEGGGPDGRSADPGATD